MNIKLYCFPYAGGASSAYNSWKPMLDSSIQLRNVELAARGRRMREPNYNTIDDAANDVFEIIKNELKEGPYAFFGHSMGSMIAFELIYKVIERGYPGPKHIFFSGRAAPQISRDSKRKLHHLSDDEFKKEMLEMGGTPKEFFEHPELLEVFLPLLRGDFRLTETFVHPEKKTLIECPVTVLSGLQDEDTREEVEAWRVHCKNSCDIQYFDGGHFFINDELSRVIQIINNALLG